VNSVQRVSFSLSLAALAAGVLATGCFSRDGNGDGERSPAFTVRDQPVGNTNLVITPAKSAVGRVASVNQQARFAVVSFPIGQVPPVDSRFAVFRGGEKTGELKMTGPTQDSFTVGDIVAGMVQEGDEVRAE
jgi:hypothetical protein